MHVHVKGDSSYQFRGHSHTRGLLIISLASQTLTQGERVWLARLINNKYFLYKIKGQGGPSLCVFSYKASPDTLFNILLPILRLEKKEMLLPMLRLEKWIS